MSQRVGAVFGHALVFGLAPVLQKAISALLLPYFTHYLATAEYGLRDLLLAVSGLFPVLLGFEHRVGFIRRYVATKDEGERQRLFSAALLFTAISAAAAAGLFLVAYPAFVLAYPAASIGPFFLSVLAVGIAVDLLNLIFLAAVQARLWAKRMVALNLAQFVVGVGLNVLFVAGLGLGPLGLFLGNTCASLLMLLGLAWIARGLLARGVGIGAAWVLCRPQLAYSLPLWGGALAYFALRYTDRFMVSRLDSLAALGIYGMAWKLSNLLVQFVLLPFQKSFDVWRFKLYEEGGDPAGVAQVFRWFMLAASAAALALATAGVDLYTALADEAYAGVGRYLPWLLVAVLLQCGCSVTSSAFFVTARTGMWVGLFVGAAALQVLGCWAAVSWMGTPGAPLALVVTNACLYAGAHFGGRRLWPVPYAHGRALSAVALVALLALGRQAIEVSWLPAALALDVAALAAFAALALAARWVRLEELRTAARWLRRRHRSDS